jgi:hypothetical protein
MKLPEQLKKQYHPAPLNAFSLGGVSLIWGHMFSLISPWWLLLTVPMIIIGFGSEAREVPEKDVKLNLS